MSSATFRTDGHSGSSIQVNSKYSDFILKKDSFEYSESVIFVVYLQKQISDMELTNECEM